MTQELGFSLAGYGNVVELRINSGGKLPNFGFVVFDDPEPVQKILSSRVNNLLVSGFWSVNTRQYFSDHSNKKRFYLVPVLVPLPFLKHLKVGGMSFPPITKTCAALVQIESFVIEVACNSIGEHEFIHYRAFFQWESAKLYTGSR